MVVADYFYLQGQRFLVYADRYTGYGFQLPNMTKPKMMLMPSGNIYAHSLVCTVHPKNWMLMAVNHLHRKQFLAAWGVRWRQ